MDDKPKDTPSVFIGWTEGKGEHKALAELLAKLNSDSEAWELLKAKDTALQNIHISCGLHDIGHMKARERKVVSPDELAKTIHRAWTFRLAGSGHLKCTKKSTIEFLRVWELFTFILSRKTRKEVFEPLYEEFMEDCLLAQRYKTKWAKRWITVCFFCKTIGMIIGCFRVMLGARLTNFLLTLVPPAVRKFLIG